MKINYKLFIEDNFQIKNKLGEIVPFKFNDTQNYYWNLLCKEYPTRQGIRENILKFRQPGFSSFIDAIFTVDFIMSQLGKIPIIDADIVSHKEKETKVLFDRVSLFLNSFFEKNKAPGVTAEQLRKSWLSIDTTLKLESRRGAQINVQTANAKVSGRGGTKQNIHWSEVAFYPNTDILNAEDLVTGAEQQVADGVGKIFRESTGNIMGDFFSEEYEWGKQPGSTFRSRFLGWWLHTEYSKDPPEGWNPPDEYRRLLDKNVSLSQIYWHYAKVQGAKPELREKTRREYPLDETEAFLTQGTAYFNKQSLQWYKEQTVMDPITKGVVYV